MKRYMVSRILYVLICLILALFYTLPSGLAETNDEFVELAPGSKGEDVKALQTRLKELGYYTKSIDGDYGNGTKAAVSAFQARNGIEVDGIATAETIRAISAETAIGAPKKPDLLITKVRFGETTSITVTNNLDVDVDRLSFQVFTYNENGEIYATNRAIDENNTGMIGGFTIERKLKAGKSATYPLDTETVFRDYNIKTASACISGYHTRDGFHYGFAPDQFYIVHSDGIVEYPENEGEPDRISDDDFDRANTISFGSMSGHIYSWTAPVFLKHEGELLIKVLEGSTFERAGLKENDIILSFNDIPVLSGNAFEKAKLQMLDGGTVIVHYWRSNKEHTTSIALDMDAVQDAVSANEPNTTELSVAEQLRQVADLYEQGLLTEEEYTSAKQAILG